MPRDSTNDLRGGGCFLGLLAEEGVEADGSGGGGGGRGSGDAGTGFFSVVFLMGKVGSGVVLLLLWASKRFRVIRKATDSSVFIGLFAADTAVADPDDEHGSLAEAEQAEAETAATAH